MSVEGLRDLARLADELSGQARGVADDVAAAKGVVWESTRAEEYRADLAGEARQVREAADELARAASALRGHADDVQHRLDQIEAAKDWFMDRLGDAQDTLAGAADAVTDTARAGAQSLVDAARSLPSPGSLDWGGFADRFR